LENLPCTACTGFPSPFALPKYETLGYETGQANGNEQVTTGDVTVIVKVKEVTGV